MRKFARRQNSGDLSVLADSQPPRPAFPNQDLTQPSRTISPVCSTTHKKSANYVVVNMKGGVMRIKLRATALAPRQPPIAAIVEAKARQSSKK